MSDAVKNFLSERLPIAGLAAYTVRMGERTLAGECLSQALAPAAAEQFLSGVLRTGQTLLPPGDRTARYCWTFEGLRVFVAARADGACLACLVENTPATQMVRLQETLQGFLDLATV